MIGPASCSLVSPAFRLRSGKNSDVEGSSSVSLPSSTTRIRYAYLTEIRHPLICVAAMEAVGVGASVVTFIALGLQSIKFIDEALSSAKDGKGYVDRARRDVWSLQASLERLGRCRAVTQNPQLALAAMIQSCTDDMKTIAEKLQGLVVDDS
jgi:hypothetical protein